MKKILYFAAVLSAFMTSCNSENEIIDNNPVKGTSTITATFDQPATRVQMGTSDGTNTPLQWNAGDQLAVYNVTSHTFGKYATVADGALTAVFNYVALAGTSEIVPEEAHLAAYPFDRIASNTFAFQYQTTQAYTANSFDPLAMPMVASNASGTEFSFSAQAAVLRLKVSTAASDVTVNSIDITSASNALTGYAAANMTNGTYGVPTANTGKTVTLDCATPVAISSTPTEFNIVVPGQTYSSGDLTITVKTNKGDFAKTSKTAATFAAGKVYNLNISGVPAPAPATTGSAAATGIDNVGWVQLWADGPKFAEFNVGVTDGNAESYGGYYCWGSSIDKGSDEIYKSGNYALSGTDDTATNLWGSAWRMPTKAELQALVANCQVVSTTVNGVNGCKFTGQGDYASNSVFLPAAGYFRFGSGVEANWGSYWSSTPDGDYAYTLDFDPVSLDFNDEYQGVIGESSRRLGCSVRAVLAE